MRFRYAPLIAAFACGSTAHNKANPDAPRKTGDAAIDAHAIDAAPTSNPAILWLTPRGADEAVVILSPTPPTFEF